MTTTVLVPKTNLFVDIQADKDASRMKSLFIRDGGSRLLADLLHKAGLANGRWTYRILTAYSTSAMTPRIQVRGPDPKAHGVKINLRPGVNNSAAKGVLFVTKDRGLTPEQVSEKLTTVTSQMYPVGRKLDPTRPLEPVPPVPEEIILVDSETELILMAVLEISAKDYGFGNLGAYFTKLRDTLGNGYDRPQEDLREIVQLLNDDGLLTRRGTYYDVSDTGREFLNPKPIEKDLKETMDEVPPGTFDSAPIDWTPAKGEVLVTADALDAVVFPPTAPPPAVPAPRVDIAQLLMRSKAKLESLAKLGDAVAQCREKQQAIRGKILDLQRELETEEAREQTMTSSFDVEALQRLLGG